MRGELKCLFLTVDYRAGTALVLHWCCTELCRCTFCCRAKVYGTTCNIVRVVNPLALMEKPKLTVEKEKSTAAVSALIT